MSTFSLSTTQVLTLGSPAIAGLFALSFLGLSRLNRRARYLRLVAAAFALFALAVSVQILWLPRDGGPNALISGALYVACVICLSEGVLRRLGRTLGFFAPLAGFLVILAGLAYFYYVTTDLIPRIIILNFGCAALLLLAAARATELLRRGTLDRLLFWVFLAFGVSFFPRTWLTLGTAYQGMGVRAFGTSGFWIALQLTLVLFGVLLAVVLMVVAMSDKIDELRRERNEDPLTGMLNRRGFEERAALCGRRSGDEPMSLIACDVDHFKQVNDTYGHGTGDDVLRQVASMLRNGLRAGDLAARTGGEEFVILLPGTGGRDAHAFAQRMRRAVETAEFAGLPDDHRITASFGVAVAARGESIDALVARADELLYAAKREGRNRVVTDLGLDSDTRLSGGVSAA